MSPTANRRDFLRLVGGGAAVAGLAGCGVFGSPENRADKTTLWYWDRSVSDDFLADAHHHIPGLKLEPDKIGGDYRSKLLTTFAGHAYAPDIAMINSDIATYFPDSDQFVDLYSLGAHEIKGNYLPWKWDLSVTPEGKCLGVPTDTGPTALMYRVDVFKSAGLPTDPDKLAPLVADWDSFFELGTRLQKKLPKTHLLGNITDDVYTMAIAAGPKRYLDKDGNFIGDQTHIRQAWDHAVKASKLKLTAQSVSNQPDWNAAITNGTIATVHNAMWESYIMVQSAPSSSGKWRVTPGPGGAGNNGGSFMTITKYCKDPKKAFEVIKWLQSPDSQTRAYSTINLFPSTVSSLSNAAILAPNKFFGGQRIGEVFSASAKAVQPAYNSPYDNVVGQSYTDQLLNVESAGKDPEKAWEEAVHDAKAQLKHLGVS